MSVIHLKNVAPIISYDTSKNIVVVSNQQLFFSLKCLKLHINYQYVLLSCISGIDFLGKAYRFGVVYDLLSLTFNQRIRIKTFVNEITSVASVTSLYINANWWEREVWDLFGIYFENHPDNKSIPSIYHYHIDFPFLLYSE